MWKKTTMQLSQEEVLDIADMKEGDFTHIFLGQDSDEIEAILKGFIDHEDQQNTKQDVANNVIRYLRKKGIITKEERCKYEFFPYHSWDSYDEETRTSVYTFGFNIYIEKQIVIEAQ